MTSMRRFRIADQGQRAPSPGSAAIAVIFVVVANLMVFGVLAAVLLPRSGAEANADPARESAVSMTSTAPSRAAASARASIVVDALATPPAALAPLSVAPGSSLVLARSAPRVQRMCAPTPLRRLSIARRQLTMQERARPATP